MSGIEKNSLSFGYWSEKHIEAQRKLNLRAFIDRAATDPKKLDEMRGLMAPFLRDTLVGFNYVHYAPPGAQVLFTNPLFVRSHDFVGLARRQPDLESHRSCWEPAGRRAPAGSWSVRSPACRTRWPKPNRTS